jgi:hypothetical protein
MLSKIAAIREQIEISMLSMIAAIREQIEISMAARKTFVPVMQYSFSKPLWRKFRFLLFLQFCYKCCLGKLIKASSS